MKRLVHFSLLAALSIPLISCDVYRRLNTAFFSQAAEAALSNEDLEILTQNLSTSVTMDTGYIADENLPCGTFESKTDTKSQDVKGNSRAEKAAYQFKKSSEGIVEVTKDFRGEFNHTENGSYEIFSNANYTYTPDKEALGPFHGQVDLTSSVSYRKNQGQAQAFKVAASRLHRSRCGIDDGEIRFSNSTHSYTITYSGCGFSRVSKAVLRKNSFVAFD